MGLGFNTLLLIGTGSSTQGCTQMR